MDALRELQSISLDYILLLFLRVSAIIWSSPVFGRTGIPAPAKIALTIALSYFFYTSVPVTLGPLYSSVPGYVLLCVKELLIGMIMGYVLSMFFYVTHTAGYLIDLQIGFGMANLYDPQTATSVPLLGNALNVMLTLLFFATGAHRELIGMLHLVVVRIPIGQITPSLEIVEVVIELFAQSFLLGVRMALPVMVASMLTEAILGMIIHSIPQMNMFVVGMPLKVLLGFIILMMVMPVYAEFSGELFGQMYEGMGRIFSMMAGA